MRLQAYFRYVLEGQVKFISIIPRGRSSAIPIRDSGLRVDFTREVVNSFVHGHYVAAINPTSLAAEVVNPYQIVLISLDETTQLVNLADILARDSQLNVVVRRHCRNMRLPAVAPGQLTEVARPSTN